MCEKPPGAPVQQRDNSKKRPVPLGPLSGAARAEAPGAARAGGVRRRRGPCRGGPTPRPGKTGCCYRPYVVERTPA